LRDREREVKNNLTKLGVKIDELTGDGAYGGAKVTIDEIESVAAMWSGIPVQRMTLDEAEILANMDEDLSGSVIGQEEAVSAVSRSLRRTRCGLKDPNRPIASMLFAGPTGVGKTELTKRLAEKYFGSEDNMVRLDMSEYMERHSVSKLVGAPPGYVGFGQGGTLTEAVRRKPFTILLFDEIEKAHPDVFNILLQMMEDGRLTDSQGRVVSFKNCLIVLTSNVGSKAISKGGGGLGFQLQDDDEEGSAEYRRIRDEGSRRAQKLLQARDAQPPRRDRLLQATREGIRTAHREAHAPRNRRAHAHQGHGDGAHRLRHGQAPRDGIRQGVRSTSAEARHHVHHRR
jgi:ATP-dependent Clp protease ATP-binding subunit ClpC